MLKPLFEEESSVENSASDCHFPPQSVSFPGYFSPYIIPASSPIDGDLCVPDIARHKLHLIEKLGEGHFGTVIHFPYIHLL